MGDVTQCPPDTLPAHLARVDDLCDLFDHLIRHDFAGTPESRMSGRQLIHPTTLADFLACLEITKRHHRCPEFVNPVQDQFDQIMGMLNTIAFFQSQQTPNIKLDQQTTEEEI